MFNKIWKLTLLTLCLTPLFACEQGDNQKEEVITTNPLITNSFANYYIIEPDEMLANEAFAIQELNYFLKLASDCTLPIVKEKAVRKNYKYISIGDTRQFREVFAEVDLSPIANTFSGYFISSHNGNLYLNSSRDYYGYGCLYGVYDMLKDMIDYTYYADDEIYYVESENINIKNYKSAFVHPSFDVRTLSSQYIYTNITHAKRLRQISHANSESWCLPLMGHNLIDHFISPNDINPETGNTYGEDAPNWFAQRLAVMKNNGMYDNRLCFSSDEEGSPKKGLIDIIANKMFQYIKQYPNNKYFMYGQEDNDDDGCQCELCRQARATWAGTTAGLAIYWMNQVIEKVEAMIENDPEESGREVRYVMYAYRATKDAPVLVDENGVDVKVDGKYVPVSDKVIPHKKLYLMYGDTSVNYSIPLTAPGNSSCYELTKKWGDLAGEQIIMYNYNANFYEYFVNFPNFSAVTSMYRTYQDFGFDYMFFNGADANLPCFFEMRSYCEANLLWDTTQNFEDLAVDFIKHYYKEASDSIYDFYSAIRDHYAYTFANNNSFGIYTAIDSEKWHFPKDYVDSLADLIEQALEEIAPLQASNPQRYQLLRDRIYREYLTVIYMRVRLYKSYYSTKEINEMKEIWDRYCTLFGYHKTNEMGGSIQIFN